MLNFFINDKKVYAFNIICLKILGAYGYKA